MVEVSFVQTSQLHGLPDTPRRDNNLRGAQRLHHVGHSIARWGRGSPVAGC